MLNGVAVIEGQVIAAGSLGQLRFTPAANVNGSGIGAFGFQVVDDGGTANGGQNTDPVPNTFRFDVTPDNDAPVANPDTVSATEDTPLTIPAATLLGNDTDASVLILGESGTGKEAKPGTQVYRTLRPCAGDVSASGRHARRWRRSNAG